MPYVTSVFHIYIKLTSFFPLLMQPILLPNALSLCTDFSPLSTGFRDYDLVGRPSACLAATAAINNGDNK